MAMVMMPEYPHFGAVDFKHGLKKLSSSAGMILAWVCHKGGQDACGASVTNNYFWPIVFISLDSFVSGGNIKFFLPPPIFSLDPQVSINTSLAPDEKELDSAHISSTEVTKIIRAITDNIIVIMVSADDLVKIGVHSAHATIVEAEVSDLNCCVALGGKIEIAIVIAVNVANDLHDSSSVIVELFENDFYFPLPTTTQFRGFHLKILVVPTSISRSGHPESFLEMRVAIRLLFLG